MLTRPQIESMPAGREMDAECARLAGFMDVRVGSDGYAVGLPPRHPSGFLGHITIPHFSTDVATAMTLVLQWDGPDWELGGSRSKSGDYSCVLYLDNRRSISGFADTVPLAISRARLLAAESEASR